MPRRISKFRGGRVIKTISPSRASDKCPACSGWQRTGDPQCLTGPPQPSCAPKIHCTLVRHRVEHGSISLGLPSSSLRTHCKPITNEETGELGKPHTSERGALCRSAAEPTPLSLCCLGTMLSFSQRLCSLQQDADIETPVKMNISVTWLC